MKKIIITALIFFSVPLHNAAQAQVISAEGFKVLVKNQIHADLKKYNLENAEINVGNVPVSRITIPDGTVSVEVISNSNSTAPKEYKKINILVNGTNVRTLYVQTEIKAFKNAAVAKEMIQRDRAITLQSVEFKKVDVLKHLNTAISEEDIARGLVSKKVFYPGEIISKNFTATRPDVLKNAIVAVHFKTESNLSIVVEGIALNQGCIGDVIQVKNKKMNKTYTGTIVGENKIEIQI